MSTQPTAAGAVFSDTGSQVKCGSADVTSGSVMRSLSICAINEVLPKNWPSSARKNVTRFSNLTATDTHEFIQLYL